MKFSAIEQATEINDVPFSKMDFAAVQKAAARLDRSARAKFGQIHFEPGVTESPRGNFPDETVIAVSGQAADEQIGIQFKI